jgi:peroxiredoxin Q/BCP
MADWIEPGQKAPAFTLAADDGTKVRLSDLAGSPVVLYFYPKDDTPGCTKEACAFRDLKQDLKKLGAKIFGVSPDDVASHVKFRDKYSLNFPLLADPDHAVAEKYGAWREKNMYGKKSMGVQRSTYLIAPDGKVAKVWKRVQVDGHDQQVLEALKELQQTRGRMTNSRMTDDE